MSVMVSLEFAFAMKEWEEMIAPPVLMATSTSLTMDAQVPIICTYYAYYRA